MKIWLCSLLIFLPMSLRAETVYMAGDSTMAIKEVKDYPETGWGVPFSVFFDDTIRVENRAKNGRSTRTFIEEGSWSRIETALKPGDFVIIQFGHNDENPNKKDRYTTPEDYKANLTRFIRETRAKGAYPLLMTPVTRRYFNESGQIDPTHPYALLARDVAAAEAVDFIDMEAISRKYFQGLGNEASTLRFMHIPPDTHPNYPHGVRDDTHFNRLGAREVAQLVLKELKRMDHPLAEKLRKPDPKHLALEY